MAVRVLSAGVLAAAGINLAAASSAAASDTPGSYTNYSWSGVSGLDDVEFPTTITKDAGPASNIYWAHQFDFTQGSGAYTGLQSNGPGQQRTFLFSVWDATEAKVGTSGSYCLDFGGEGVGKSCRIKHDWKEGHTFRFRVAHEGDRWFGVTVVNDTLGTSFKLGSIRAGSTQISPHGMVDWTEYFEWNNPKASCNDQPFSQARFGLPKGNKGSVTAAVSSTKTSVSCSDMSRIDRVSGGTVQSNAIGNSLRGPVLGIGGKALDASSNTSGDPAIIYTPTGGANQAFVRGRDGTVRPMSGGLCLDVEGGATANGTPVILYTCTAGPNQQWRHESGRLRNPASGRCLDVPNSSTANGTRLAIWDCHTAPNQQWAVPPIPSP
ncbi:RICIN domain-containing protein [Spirillospora sp. CA-294931]|uniref:RICIN domain-containing protein n=1 Tax=Spirillospora sp. CA-294931 TaxID=3240042 RepID=UPI003D915A20